MLTRVTTSYGYPQAGREHWQVNRAGEKHGPWCIQKAVNTGLGLAFDLPKPEHCNFPTRKVAEHFKRNNLRGTL
jgi:hypothetical protein